MLYNRKENFIPKTRVAHVQLHNIAKNIVFIQTILKNIVVNLAIRQIQRFQLRIHLRKVRLNIRALIRPVLNQHRQLMLPLNAHDINLIQPNSHQNIIDPLLRYPLAPVHVQHRQILKRLVVRNHPQ